MSNWINYNQAWWNENKNKYPFHTTTSTKVRPEHISVKKYGHHASAVLAKEVRTWGFLTEKQRDRFIVAEGK